MTNFKNLVKINPPELNLGDLLTYRPATINWAATGYVTPDEAIEFANAIIEKANEAKKLNKDLNIN